MPLTHRGREILSRVPGGSPAEHHRRRLRDRPPRGALRRLRHLRQELPERRLRARRLLRREPAAGRAGGQPPRRARRRAARLMQHEPDGPVEVPERVTVYRTIVYDDEKCLGCGTCARGCPADAIEARPPQADAAPTQPAAAEGVQRMSLRTATAPARPLVLLCECAGTLRNIDFDRLEQHASLHADVLRGTHWCSRGGQAQLLRADGGRRPAARLRRLLAGLRRAPAAEALRARPPAGDRRHPRGLQLGPRRRRRRRDRQGHADRRLVRALPGRAGRHHGLRRAPRHRRGHRRRRGRHAGRRRARQDGTSGRAHRAAALPRRPRRPHRHRVPHQRLRPVPARRRRPGGHAQVLPPQRLHRPPQPHHPPARHRRGRHRAPRGLRGERPPPAQHGHRRLHQLRDLRDGLRGRGVRARQEGHLHRVLRRPGRAHRRPRHLHASAASAPRSARSRRSTSRSRPRASRSTPAPSSPPSAASRRRASTTPSSTPTTRAS